MPIPNNTLEAFAMAVALLRNAVAVYEEVAAVFERAKAEGRDVSNAELAALRLTRDNALAEWRKAAGL